MVQERAWFADMTNFKATRTILDSKRRSSFGMSITSFEITLSCSKLARMACLQLMCLSQMGVTSMVGNHTSSTKVFDCPGIDFIGTLPSSYFNQHILVAVYYVSKWVKAIAVQKNDTKIVVKFLKKNNIAGFGVTRI
ncbi:hypothetical protein CR513_62829, partial [Mucuna pruriens]